MSGFSSPEFLLIVVLALVVLGPKRLPEIANKIGGWVGQARRMTRVMKRQLEEELNVDDLNQIASPERLLNTPDPKKAPDPADPAYDDSNYIAEADAAAADTDATDPDAAGTDTDKPAPDHIPNDDDSYSPLHADDDTEKSA
jgi:sec-independent protein translocase protein TatB